MKVQNKIIKKLLKKYKEIATLNKISAVLGWDLNVNLPSEAIEERSKQLAFLAKLTTEKWLGKDFKRLLNSAERSSVAKAMDDKGKAIVRNLKYGAKFYHQVPKELIIKLEETSSKAYVAWDRAKKENNFSLFSPHLEKLVESNKKIAKKYGYKENPYDALLDIHEPGLTTKEVKDIFFKLTPELVKILKKIKPSKNANFKDQKYPLDSQKKLSKFVLQKMGYDFTKGRMDVSSHPFTTNFGTTDVRITNRYNEFDFREGLTAGMHEGGHALYEQNIKPEYENTPLAGGVSLGIHESQSRFWENMIGRSQEFSKFIFPILQTLFGDNFKDATSRDLFEFLNQVKPSFIRTEADEVTYNLHVAIRFEIEEGLINGKIKVKDIPNIWNKKMKKYLGIIPDTDTNGCLQDVHWSQGLMGYFPTYTLGNLYSAQFAKKMKKDIKNIDKLIEKGKFEKILNWLIKNIHMHGSYYLPSELVKKVTGEKLNPNYFVKYLQNKYFGIYNL